MRPREDEKVEKYRDLACDVGRVCVVRTRVIIGIISLKGEEFAFVATFQENVSLSKMRSGMTMFQKVCLKMKIQTVVGPHCVNR